MIRAATPGDLWALRRKPRSAVLFPTEHLLARPHRAWMFGLRCALEGPGSDGATVVAYDPWLRAMVQARGRNGRPEFDIVFMAAYNAPGRTMRTDQEAWYHALHRLCELAGTYRIQRIYAPLLHSNDDLREIFRQLGFQSYAQQTILRLEGPDWDQGTTLAPMRPQHRRDEWGIQKLYGLTTPHVVQHVEVRNAPSWRLPLAEKMGSARRRAWVLGPENDLAAYLQISGGPGGHVLNVLIRSEARDTFDDVLRFGMAQITESGPIYLMLREYQSELITLAQTLGFHPVADQTLLVKSMIVALRRPVLVPALEGGLEPSVNISIHRAATAAADEHAVPLR